MAKTMFTFVSADGKTPIHCVSWSPEADNIRGILQIAHGMVEYIERYEDFAGYMNAQGYLVVGHDHLGHGQSVLSTEDWGYFAQNGGDILIEDMHTLRVMEQKQYPGLPYFMLGHSMGSFLLRKYLCVYGNDLRGAIIMGTGSQPTAVINLGKALCRVLALPFGWRRRSNLMQNMVLGSYDKKFEETDLPIKWLTKDVAIAEEYVKNPKTSFVFTLNGFYHLLDTMWYNNQKKYLGKMPKKLPLFFVSGEEDPVGNFGKAVKQVYDTYENIGMYDITWKLYPTDRHEILNELDRKQVYEDILHWMLVREIT